MNLIKFKIGDYADFICKSKKFKGFSDLYSDSSTTYKTKIAKIKNIYPNNSLQYQVYDIVEIELEKINDNIRIINSQTKKINGNELIEITTFYSELKNIDGLEKL